MHTLILRIVNPQKMSKIHESSDRKHPLKKKKKKKTWSSTNAREEQLNVICKVGMEDWRRVEHETGIVCFTPISPTRLLELEECII